MRHESRTGVRRGRNVEKMVCRRDLGLKGTSASDCPVCCGCISLFGARYFQISLLKMGFAQTGFCRNIA